jgi:phosphohistidine phosphatase
MKQLLVLRHAATQMSAAARGDRGRDLTDEGCSDAKALGAFMKAEGLIPDAIACSSADRTRQTLDYLMATFGGNPRVQFEDALYGADERTLLGTANGAPADVSSFLIIAHNPGVHGFIMELISEVSAGVEAEPLMQGYPAGTLSVLTFKSDDWRQVAPHTGLLTCCKAPDEL